MSAQGTDGLPAALEWTGFDSETDSSARLGSREGDEQGNGMFRSDIRQNRKTSLAIAYHYSREN